MEAWKKARRSIAIFRQIIRYLRLSNFEQADFRALKQRFSRELLRHLRFDIKSAGIFKGIEGPAIFVCNHLSYMDIPLIMNRLPRTSFVSKSEVSAWPIIGTAAKRIDTIFVKRECKDSRQNTRTALIRALKEKKHIVVFPSGTTSLGPSDRWRKGIFEIAAELQVPVVPVRLSYSPKRELAYVDRDNFILHLYRLVGLERIRVRFEFGRAQQIREPLVDCEKLKAWCEAGMAGAPDTWSEFIPWPA